MNVIERFGGCRRSPMLGILELWQKSECPLVVSITSMVLLKMRSQRPRTFPAMAITTSDLEF
jgi:hypothetical protein